MTDTITRGLQLDEHLSFEQTHPGAKAFLRCPCCHSTRIIPNHIEHFSEERGGLIGMRCLACDKIYGLHLDTWWGRDGGGDPDATRVEWLRV